jgi:Mn2+/Fe2+ NRAMP family transporter
VIVASTLVGVTFNFLHIDPIRAPFITSLINGVLAPLVLVLIVLLGSARAVMKERVSGPLSRVPTWTAAVVMTAAALALLVTALPPFNR